MLLSVLFTISRGLLNGFVRELQNDTTRQQTGVVTYLRERVAKKLNWEFLTCWDPIFDSQERKGLFESIWQQLRSGRLLNS